MRSMTGLTLLPVMARGLCQVSEHSRRKCTKAEA